MNDSNLLQTLGQVSSGSAGEVLRDHLRGMVRQMITDVIAEEVTELCGPQHRPAGGNMYALRKHGSHVSSNHNSLLKSAREVYLSSPDKFAAGTGPRFFLGASSADDSASGWPSENSVEVGSKLISGRNATMTSSGMM